ncbi:hypothetical protein B7P43_G01130 [Cryptotermes secundus]|uniref:Uncharacterized protein n=2 Tax=Cryptotermes secundus TaxID=105785 RepID=A0A2J7QZT8_9NEOP|nr:hypothetical protein B7P43_G01130 [Cryptotermes secundus]
MFKPSKIHHTEKILEELMSENEGILQSINEEKEIAEHNLQELEKFLNEMNVSVLSIINEQKNLEEQMKQYGYTPLAETHTTLQEKESSNDAMVDEHNGSDASSWEEQLEGISIASDTTVQDIYNMNMTSRAAPPSEPLFSKYYYLALGLPVPPQVLNSTASKTCT